MTCLNDKKLSNLLILSWEHWIFSPSKLIRFCVWKLEVMNCIEFVLWKMHLIVAKWIIQILFAKIPVSGNAQFKRSRNYKEANTFGCKNVGTPVVLNLELIGGNIIAAKCKHPNTLFCNPINFMHLQGFPIVWLQNTEMYFQRNISIQNSQMHT